MCVRIWFSGFFKNILNKKKKSKAGLLTLAADTTVNSGGGVGSGSYWVGFLFFAEGFVFRRCEAEEGKKKKKE